MKKLTIFGLLFLYVTFSSFSQPNEVTNAIFDLNDGNLDKAKESIDKAILHEKTNRKGKTWFYRGAIYEQIHTTPKYSNISVDALKMAIEAYQKTLEYDTPNGEYGSQVAQRIENCWVLAFNEGVNNYNQKKFAEALQSYKLAQSVKPNDTTAFIYGAYAAEQIKNYAEIKISFNKLKDLNYSSPVLYSMMAKAFLDENKMEEALNTLVEASKKYPANNEIMTNKLTLYMKMGKEVEAVNEFRIAVEREPKNKLLWAKLGEIYGKQAKTDSAIYCYQKAIEIDTLFATAYFNTGVYYNNLAAEKITAANATSDLAQAQVLQKEGEEFLQKAMPFLEKSYTLSPTDIENMQILMKLYLTLKFTDKATEMNNKIKEMQK